jgi:transcriptional antiterminator NusG
MATWYTVKVQPEREEKVRNLLEERIKFHGAGDKIRTLLIPTESMTEIRGGKKRIVEQKTLPGYLFIEMDLDDECWHLINETTGVTGFVSANPRDPQPLPDEEMDRILVRQEDEKPKPKVEFEIHQEVRIKNGPFENFQGEVEEIHPDKGILKVMVPIFGRKTPVELEYHEVERM